MKSAPPGPSTSAAEVTSVSPHGFWLFVGERELFVPFKEFPWFREASVREITNVQLPSPHRLYWPDLDIDLALESIEHLQKYPLVSNEQPPIEACAADDGARSSQETDITPPQPKPSAAARSEALQPTNRHRRKGKNATSAEPARR